jgi:hypothetical protein
MIKIRDGLLIGARRFVGVWIILTTSVAVFTVIALFVSRLLVASDVVLGLALSGALIMSVVLIVRFGNDSVFAGSRERKITIRRVDLSPRVMLHRARLILRGAPKLDLAVDVARLVSFATLGVILIAHVIFETPALHGPFAAMLTTTAVVIVFVTSFVYPMARKQSLWDREYRYRKALFTHALNYATAALIAKRDVAAEVVFDTVQVIERDALEAIRSYLEYSVLDSTHKNFHVNLILPHPKDASVLVCVVRTNSNVSGLTFYKREEMTIASSALDEGKPLYIGDFRSRRGRPYRMIWHIPILIATDGGTKSGGLVAIDSMIPHHLDLLDEREMVLFNIMPYLALLRFSLTLRSENRIWHSIIIEELTENQMDSASPAAYHLDRAMDKEALTLSAGDLDSEYRALRRIADDIEAITPARRVFSILFPNVEKNNQRVRA